MIKTNPKTTQKTTSRTTVKTQPSAASTRRQDLQLMLMERERELQTLFRRRVRSTSIDGPVDGLDETEHAEADIQEHVEVALIQLKGETLQRVREALVRLEAGEYGRCTECDEEISEKRLQALPFAARCKSCEELHEQSGVRDRVLTTPHGLEMVFSELSRQ